MKKQFCAHVFMLLVSLSLTGQVTIGSSKAPLEGTLLMLDDGTTGSAGENAQKGLSMPRVELQAYNILKMGVDAEDLTPLSAEHIGLLVYNTNKKFNECDPNSIPSGLHVWDGAKWVGIGTAPHQTSGGLAKRPGPDEVYAPNSYIATQGSTISIPVKKAFAMWDWWGGGSYPEGRKLLAQTSANFGSTMYVKVLWEESEEGVITAGNIIQSVSFSSTSTVASTAKNDGATIYVKIAANAVGNAVVTISDSSTAGNVRWSWHIWVPKDDPTAITYTLNTGKQTNVFMDRNLGASRNGVVVADRDYTAGMQYQWGRKDPFPGNVKLGITGTKKQTTVPVDISNTLVTAKSLDGDNKSTGLKYAINHPLAFIKYESTNSAIDWFSNTKNDWDSRWGDTGSTATDACSSRSYKSEMDPCPEGWRVPAFEGNDEIDLVNSPWAKLGEEETTSNKYIAASNFLTEKGYNFTDAGYLVGWYAAAGYRNLNAELFDATGNGYYWSASPSIAPAAPSSNYQAFNLGILNLRVSPASKLYRASGASVRCVKE